MASSILAKLEACYGAERVVDVFANTGIALKARDLNIGCYVVRGVLTSAQLAAWHQALTTSLNHIADTVGSRAVDLKGSRPGPPVYRTIQCVAGKCNCKYAYAATSKHKVYKVSEVEPFSDVCNWLHGHHNVGHQNYFDEIVANLYSRAANQCAGYHTDQSELLGATSNIMSVSMGAAGVFYWRPSPEGELRGWNAKEAARHETQRKEGLWGCTPLMPGYLMLCSGTFQHHLYHGSLNYVEAANVEEVARDYKLCPEALKVLNSKAYLDYFNSRVPQLDRSVITFRKIENHYAACPALVTGARGLSVSPVIATWESWVMEGASRARGDRQHEVIPGEPPESQGAQARPEGPTQLQERAAAPQFAAGLREVNAEARSLWYLLPEDSEPLVPPQPQRDDAVSPSNVCHTAEEQQVKAAEECMQSCFEQIDKLEDILEASQPDTGGLVAETIRETMVQLVTNIRESSRVQNIAECRLEVAASLFLIFKMIIPVM